MAQRWPKDCPRWRQDGPNMAQHGPIWPPMAPAKRTPKRIRPCCGQYHVLLAPRWSKMAQRWHKIAPDGSKMAQNGPRWPQIAPGKPKMTPRWPQDGPKKPQDGPRWPQDGPKMAPRSPKMAQDGPKMAPRSPKMAQDGPILGPIRRNTDPNQVGGCPEGLTISCAMFKHERSDACGSMALLRRCKTAALVKTACVSMHLASQLQNTKQSFGQSM